MLVVKSEPLELRGIANRENRKGECYYLLNCEDIEGTPYQLYCPNANALPQGLRKGDNVTVMFHVKRFERNEYLEVVKVEKVGA